MKPRAVLIRLDKIGDLVSTLPVDELEPLKDFDVHWIVSQGLAFVADHAVPKRQYLELRPAKKLDSFFELLKFLKETKPAISISFQGPWWVSLAMWLAQVPVRGGRQSQWHSWLFLTRGLRQRRSQATQHEADYNRDLVYFTLKFSTKNQATPILKLMPNPEVRLEKWNLLPQQYVVIHPGMAGSALNWKIKNYIELIQQVKADLPVVITGTPLDEPWLIEIKREFAGDSRVHILQNLLSTTELLTVLAHARAVVAPSTGVAHLAASLGTKVIGIYSPLQVQSPTRWQTRGPKVIVKSPAGPCPAQFVCLETKCRKFFCMDEITVQEVLNALEL